MKGKNTDKMIECKPFRAKYLTPATCIRNHQELDALAPAIDQIKKNRKSPYGKTWNQMIYPTRYYTLKHCLSCKEGTRYYQQILEAKKKTPAPDITRPWNVHPSKYRQVPGFI